MYKVRKETCMKISKKITRAAIKKFLKSYGASATCFLLSIVICISGTVSYSRYVSGGEFFEQPGIGTFAGSGTVYDVSALSFTNMAFWGGLEDIGVSMNSLRTLSFNVNNSQQLSNGESKVSEVPLKYSIIFSAPKNFASKLAIQLFDEEDSALTSQIVITDIINAVYSGSFTTVNPPIYNGKEYNGLDENGNPTKNMIFDVTLDSQTGIYTATSKGKDETVITLEPFVMEDMKQMLYFRLWDVEHFNETSLTEEKGTLLPPLQMSYVKDIDCYKITVSRPDFLFPAATYTEHNYSLTLAPTDALLDSHLGGYLMQKNEITGEYYNATELSVNSPIYLSTVKETVVKTNLGSNTTDDSVTLMGNIPMYIEGRTETFDVVVPDQEKFEHVQLDPTVTETPISTGTPTYYRRRWGTSYTTGNSSNSTYAMRKDVVQNTKTTTKYHVTIKIKNTATETVTTGTIERDANGTIVLVNQSGKVVTDSSYEIVAAKRQLTIETTYSIKTVYLQKVNDSWVEMDDISSFPNVSTVPKDPIIQNTATTEELDAEDLTEDELEAFKETDEAKALLKNSTSEESFTKVISYESYLDEIIPTELKTNDESVNLSPLKTHLSSGIQKYYVSTSYSKNYPFFVKIFVQQIQD